MSNFIKVRDAEQCRTHHQKMCKKYGKNLTKMIKLYYEEKKEKEKKEEEQKKKVKRKRVKKVTPHIIEEGDFDDEEIKPLRIQE